jgi:LytS/YehU family sensor histidine kinase
MALVALLALMLGSFAGLLIGRWVAAVPLVAAIPAAGVLAGPEVGAVAVLAAAGLLAGVHLHRVVAEQYAPR